MRARRPAEDGVTLVEVAFVIPVLFLLVFALLDIGLWVFDSTQAAAAARDGARAAELDYLRADVTGSADNAIVRAAATRHIDVDAPTVAVRCLRLDSTAVTCLQAKPGEDRIEVTVSWDRDPLTYVGRLLGDRAQRVSATSAMNISGRPVAPT